MAEFGGLTGFGLCAPTVVAVIVRGACTTREVVALVIELVPQVPVPPVDVAVTESPVVVAAGVESLVVIVSIDVGELFETVVGLNEAVAPVGSVPLNTRGIEVQVVPPAHVAVIVYVAEEFAVTGLGACVPTATAVIVDGVTAVTVSVWVGALLKAPVPVAVMIGLPAVVSLQKKLAEFADAAMLTLVIEVVQVLLLQKAPPTALVRATVSVVAGLATLPLASCDCTVICGEQAPARMLTGDVVNASLVAAPLKVTMSAAQSIALLLGQEPVAE